MTPRPRAARGRVVPDRVIVELRSNLPRVIARIATMIQTEVAAYAGPVLGKRRGHIENAVGAGMGGLHGLLVGRARADLSIADLFRNLGLAEGLAGQSLEAMQTALNVAIRETWVELHHVATAQRVSAFALGQIVDLMFVQADRLRDEFEAGHQAGVGMRDADPEIARARLGHLLFDEHEPAAFAQLAGAIGWEVPKCMFVVGVRLPAGSPPVDPGQFAPDLLVVTSSTDALVLGDVAQRESLTKQVRTVWPSASMAISLPSGSEQVFDALRLVRRALRLAETGVIVEAEVVDCAEHEVELWVQAEPILRERIAERLFGAFAVETPHRRQVLAVTLLMWLEQRASAPALAQQLGVHPQTVRQRLRRLARMFGNDLQDPDVSFGAMLALKATLPMWMESPPTDGKSAG